MCLFVFVLTSCIWHVIVRVFVCYRLAWLGCLFCGGFGCLFTGVFVWWFVSLCFCLCFGLILVCTLLCCLLLRVKFVLLLDLDLSF